MPSTIQLYTKENCPKCKMTKKLLDAQGTSYQVIDLTDTESETTMKHLTYIKDTLGYASLPVVILPDGTHFNGFEPNKLKGLK